GEEPDEGAPFLADMIADRSPQHWIGRLQRVEHRALGCRSLHIELQLAAHLGQPAQMGRQHNPNHCSVWTSTESSAGTSRTIGAQLSPASAEALTWPPDVPKYTPPGSSASTAIASRKMLR